VRSLKRTDTGEAKKRRSFSWSNEMVAPEMTGSLGELSKKGLSLRYPTASGFTN